MSAYLRSEMHLTRLFLIILKYTVSSKLDAYILKHIIFSKFKLANKHTHTHRNKKEEKLFFFVLFSPQNWNIFLSRPFIVRLRMQAHLFDTKDFWSKKVSPNFKLKIITNKTHTHTNKTNQKKPFEKRINTNKIPRSQI